MPDSPQHPPDRKFANPAKAIHASIEELGTITDFRRIYYLLWQRWWIIAIFMGLSMLASLGYVMRQPKIYESRAVVQVQQSEQQVVNIDGVSQENPSSPDFINTVVQSIMSRNLMLRVIDANKLRTNPTFVAPGAKPTDIQLADKLRSKVKASLRRGTRLIDITVEDKDPVMARDLAVSFVKEFLRENFSQRLSVSRVATDFLQEEGQKLKRKLEESELKLQRYKEQNQAVSLEERQNITVERLRELSSKATEAKGERIRLESDIEQVRKVSANNTEELLRIGSVAVIPQVAEARRQLMEADTEVAALQDRYGQRHPKFIAAMTKIDSLKKSLRESAGKAGDILNRQYEAAVQTESKLTAALKEQEGAALDLNKMAIPFNVLQREVESDRALYDSVIKRMKETAVTGAVEQSPYILIEEPLVASLPSKPNRTRSLAMAMVMSFFLAIAGVIFFDSLNSSLRSVDEAESILHLPALVGIPNHAPTGLNRFKQAVEREKGALPGRIQRARNLTQSKQGKESTVLENLQDLIRPAPIERTDSEKYPIATIEEPESGLAEAYRTLRVSISMLGPEEERRVLLFVSAIPEEGKTYTSLNTAVVFAQQGLKTILIDFDLRRPSLHKALLTVDTLPIGLTDYFSGNARLPSIIIPTEIENLSLIPAGHRAPNPAELLSSADIPKLFAQLLKRYDRIVVDSAPVNAVSDTLIVAPHADKTILVVRAGKTPRKAILRSLHLLRKAQAKMAGFVLNRLPSGRAASYYYYYYGDKYEKDSVYGSRA
jgi:capsular exopolysaccharide synthesis family protein